jgi:hypothetical protein
VSNMIPRARRMWANRRLTWNVSFAIASPDSFRYAYVTMGTAQTIHLHNLSDGRGGVRVAYEADDGNVTSPLAGQ